MCICSCTDLVPSVGVSELNGIFPFLFNQVNVRKWFTHLVNIEFLLHMVTIPLTGELFRLKLRGWFSPIRSIIDRASHSLRSIQQYLSPRVQPSFPVCVFPPTGVNHRCANLLYIFTRRMSSAANNTIERVREVKIKNKTKKGVRFVVPI